MIELDSTIFKYSLEISLFQMSLALVFIVFRLVKGPKLPDRILALDLFTIVSSGIVGLFSIRTQTPAYFDVALAISLMAFLGAVAFTRYVQYWSSDNQEAIKVATRKGKMNNE